MLSIVLVLAGLVSLPPASGTQSSSTPAEDGKREFTISGCLLRSGYAGYQVDDAQVDAIDGKSTAAPQASSPSSTSSVVPKKWILEGGGNLGARVGEKVQVVGRSDWQSPSATGAPEEPPNRTPRLQVKSLKTLAPKCS